MLRCPSRNSTGAGHCWRLRRTSHRGFHQILSWHCCMLSANWHETTIERTWLFHFFLNWKQDGVILWDCNFGLLQKGDFVVTCRQFPFETAFLLQVQDILSRRHGMQQEHIERIPAQRHGAMVWELVNWWIAVWRTDMAHGTLPWHFAWQVPCPNGFRMFFFFLLHDFAHIFAALLSHFADGIRRPTTMTTMDKRPAWPSPRTKTWSTYIDVYRRISTWGCHHITVLLSPHHRVVVTTSPCFHRVFWVSFQGLSVFLVVNFWSSVISETLRCASMLSKQTMRHLETSKRDSNTASKLSLGLFTVNHYIVESRW